MIKALTTAAFALALTTTLAVAQSSQPQAGTDQSTAAQMNKNSDGSMGGMTSEKMGKSANAHNAMKKKKKMKKPAATDSSTTAPPADSMKK